MVKTDPSLIAHLYRRAGFGASFQELKTLSGLEYTDIVENLLNPETIDPMETDILRRYHLELNDTDSIVPQKGEWIFRMVNTPRTLEEKNDIVLALCVRYRSW
jgi:hypothetical protein